MRDYRVTKIHYSTVLRFSIVTGLIITLLLCLFSKKVSDYFEEPRMLEGHFYGFYHNCLFSSSSI